jgi:hypothetical protein
MYLAEMSTNIRNIKAIGRTARAARRRLLAVYSRLNTPNPPVSISDIDAMYGIHVIQLVGDGAWVDHSLIVA